MYPGTLLEAGTRKQRPETWPQISSPEFQLPNLNSKPQELQAKTNHENGKKKNKNNALLGKSSAKFGTYYPISELSTTYHCR